ncbi:putative amino acid transporter, transmembrane domain-containing protein [Helianthus anomalus]
MTILPILITPYGLLYSAILTPVLNISCKPYPCRKIARNIAESCTIGIGASTLLYMICGILGYLAFGNDSSGNYLTGFGFYEPFWLVDNGNICVVRHLLGAFQNWSREKWPRCKFIEEEYIIGKYNIIMFRLTWRTFYVILVAIVAMMFPFFNSFMGVIGSTTYWPLTIYFPIEMYISWA